MSRKDPKKSKKGGRKSKKQEAPATPEDMHEELLESSSSTDLVDDPPLQIAPENADTSFEEDSANEITEIADATDSEMPTEKQAENQAEQQAKKQEVEQTGVAAQSSESLTFGVWLRKQREDRSISLEEVAAVTKVHIYQLKIIEDEQWEQLPAPAFVRGFLVCYAKYLNLDEEDVLKRYRDAMGTQSSTIEAALPAGLKGVKSSSKPAVRVASAPNFQKAPGAKNLDEQTAPLLSPKSIGVVLAVIAVVIILVTLVSIGKNDSQSDAAVTVESKPAATEKTDTSASEETAKSKEAEATQESAKQPSSPASKLQLIGVEESWINTKIDTQDSAGSTLRKGQVKSFEVTNKVNLILSNAGAVNIRWNGKLYDAPGFRGDVRRLELPKDLAQLKEKKTPPRPKPKPPQATNTSTSTSGLPGAPANSP